MQKLQLVCLINNKTIMVLLIYLMRVSLHTTSHVAVLQHCKLSTCYINHSNLLSAEGDDYMSVGPFQFTFDRNRVAYNINIPLVNDNVHEPTEQFSTSLSTNEDAYVVTLNPESTNIRILDDDGGY